MQHLHTKCGGSESIYVAHSINKITEVTELVVVDANAGRGLKRCENVNKPIVTNWFKVHIELH